MEISEQLLQFKQSMAKYTRSRLLHIAEAAEELKVTEKYLAELARSGKLQAFKIGDHWFLEEKWLQAYRGKLKGLLDAEIGNHRLTGNSLNRRWIRSLVPSEKIYGADLLSGFFRLSFRGAIATIVLAFVGLSFVLFCLPLAQVGLNRTALAQGFLKLTFAVYGAPTNHLSVALQDLPAKINDEKLTQALYRWTGQNPPGQVAGEFETANE